MEDDAISAGLPSYIIQEEFNRFEGFWWQPNRESEFLILEDFSAKQYEKLDLFVCISLDRKIYRIMYEEVDESGVNLVSLLTLPGREPEKYRFPTPGKRNINFILKYESVIHLNFQARPTLSRH
jgi:dipeptidyl-peptidase 9